MYKLLLILRYFQRKLVAVFALLAVALCTAMVIIVISVMGGFLDLMTHTAKNLSGDVVIHRGLGGFSHYEQMLDGLRGLPEVAGATTTVQGYGLIKLHGYIIPVQVTGIRPEEFNTVTRYRNTLHWKSQDYLEYWDRLLETYPPEEGAADDRPGSRGAGGGDKEKDSWRRLISQRRKWYERHDLIDESMKFKGPRGKQGLPGIIPGIAVSPSNERDHEGQYHLWDTSTGVSATLTTVPIAEGGALQEPSVEEFNIVNEFKSGFMELDLKFVFVEFDVLQRMLWMDVQAETDPETGEPTGNQFPARTTEIMVRGTEGYTLEEIERSVEQFVSDFCVSKQMARPIVKNWLEDRFGMILAAVKKEKGMMAFLFGIISLVAVVMVAVIFYMIVMDKTRDIGVLRAIGASRLGIVDVFLGYALVVGIIGASIGLALAAVVVWNLNEIQDLLAAWTGFKMWDPKIYYFDRIPSRLDRLEVTIIMVCAVVASVLGALIPAWLAGRTDPVASLRYE